MSGDTIWSMNTSSDSENQFSTIVRIPVRCMIRILTAGLTRPCVKPGFLDDRCIMWNAVPPPKMPNGVRKLVAAAILEICKKKAGETTILRFGRGHFLELAQSRRLTFQRGEKAVSPVLDVVV